MLVRGYRVKPLRLVAVAAVLIAVCASACFGTAAKSSRAVESASGADPSATPFKIEVVEELHDGADLVIKGRLTAKSEWPADEVVVRLAALDESGQQRLSFHRMSDLSPKSGVLGAGVPETFSQIGRAHV